MEAGLLQPRCTNGLALKVTLLLQEKLVTTMQEKQNQRSGARFPPMP